MPDAETATVKWIVLYSTHYTMNVRNRNGCLVVAAVAGAVATLAALRARAPRLLIEETESPHGFETTTERFEAAVEAAGWQILTVHDLQAKMDRHGYDVERTTVYEICAPEHASRILSGDAERLVSPMMPCRVSIYEHGDGHTSLARMNTGLVAALFGGVIRRTMGDASAESEAMIEATLDPHADPQAAVDR